MTSPWSSTESKRSELRRPDWAAPSMSPSRRWRRSTSDSAKPSRVAATASTRSRAASLLDLGHEQAHRRLAASADAAAELVQLADPEPVSVHDDHDRGVRDVDSDLDHGGGDEHVDGAGGEPPHHVVLGVGRHLTVEDLHPTAL